MGTVYSDVLTDLRSSPIVLGKRARKGNQNVIKGTIELATGDIDAGDIIHLCRVPMGASIQAIRIFNDDLDSHGTPTLAANIGLYYVSDGTALDADCYATAITTLQAANVLGVDHAFEVRDIASINNEVWQDGGLSTQVDGLAYISLTISNAAATAVAGTLSFIVEYVN